MLPLFSWLFQPQTVLTDGQRQTAHYIIGEPGTGKSRYLESLVKQDIEAGLGVSFVDVAGGAYQRLEAWLALRPQLWPRLVLIDLQHPNYLVRVNPLATTAGMAIHHVSEFFRSMMMEIWDVDVDDTPRMAWMMANTFHGLAAAGLTLTDMEEFLTNKPFRDAQLQRLPPEMEHIRRYFATQFGRAPGGVYPFILPTLSRIGPLLFDPDIRLMHAGRDSLDFRRVMDDGLIVLANLPKGYLAPEPSKLVAAFLVARYQQAAVARANTFVDDGSARRPHYLYLDEFGNYTTSNIVQILSESRQFKLRLIMAHQFLAQLSPELQSGVLNTSGVVSCMRTGFEDARVLAPIIFPREDYYTHREMKYRIIGSGLASSVMAEQQTRPYGWDALAEVLANQANRMVWVRRKGATTPAEIYTHDMPDLRLTPQLVDAIAQMREECGKRFGVKREEAVRELEALEKERAAVRAAAKAKDDAQPKRKRGRPKGSKTKKSEATETAK